MTEDFWANSQFSIARYYGRVGLDGYDYLIVNKEGKDIFECSAEAEKAGREHAIEPGEPADLCRSDFVKYYKKLKRDRFFEVLRENPNASDKELLEIFKQLTAKKK